MSHCKSRKTLICLNSEKAFSSYLLNQQKINKQTNLSSSHFISNKKSLVISKQVGQSANPQKLSQCGGPGDLWSSKNKSKYGVDKKHGSYDRYLSRKKGGVLRKEKLPGIFNNRQFLLTEYNNHCTSNSCCDNRIPVDCKSCSIKGELCKGCFGNNTQGVPQRDCKKKCILLK